MSIAQHYNEIAANYENIHPLREEAVAKIVSYIKSNGISGLTVDFGGGTGAMLKAVQAAANLKAEQLLLIDLSPGMCAEAQNKGIKAIQVPYESTTLPDTSVSLAIFHESIHHTQDKLKLQQELKRVLSPEGRLLVFFQTDWYIEPPSDILQKYIFMARKNRKTPEEVINDLLGNQFPLIKREELVSTNEVNLQFVQDAILNAALSYWNKIHIEERSSDVSKIKGEEFALIRKIACFEFTR